MRPPERPRGKKPQGADPAADLRVLLAQFLQAQIEGQERTTQVIERLAESQADAQDRMEHAEAAIQQRMARVEVAIQHLARAVEDLAAQEHGTPGADARRLA